MVEAATPDIAGVIDAEKRRGAALVARDLAALRALLAPELTHTHTRGVTDSRDSFLHFVEHDIRYLSAERGPLDVRLHGNFAIMTGTSENGVHLNGLDPLVSRAQVLQVWEWRDGRWQLLAFQSTSLPKDAVDPYSSYGKSSYGKG